MSATYKDNLDATAQQVYLEVLIYVLGGDKKLTKEQTHYLERQAQEIGFPLSELKNVKKIKRPESLSNELLKIEDIRLRRYFVREMIMLAISDHELTDAEMCDIYKIGCAIGVKEDKINDFFLWAAQGVEWQIEGVRMVEDDL